MKQITAKDLCQALDRRVQNSPITSLNPLYMEPPLSYFRMRACKITEPVVTANNLGISDKELATFVEKFLNEKPDPDPKFWA